MPKLKQPSMQDVSWPDLASDERDGVRNQTYRSRRSAPTPTAATTAADGSDHARRAHAVAARRCDSAKPRTSRRATQQLGQAGSQPSRAASPWQSMSDGADASANSTEAAWHKTVDAVTPGDSTAARADRSRPAVHQATVVEQDPRRIRGCSPRARRPSPSGWPKNGSIRKPVATPPNRH